MSLAEKLSKLSKELEVAKVTSENEKQENELKPVRAKVAELEIEKAKLERLKNSLVAKKENDHGMGMGDYRQLVEHEKAQSYEKVKKLFEENKESLASLGVTNVDELLAYPEFQEDEEVVSYRAANEHLAEVREADDKFKEQLQTLGIPVAEKFTYTEAAKSLNERLGTVREELLAESLKLPEKKKEVVEMIAEQIEPKLYAEEYSEERDSIRRHGEAHIETIGKLNIGGSNYYNLDIKIIGDNAEYYTHRSNPEEWMPSADTIKDLPHQYGQELIDEAITEAYRKKTLAAVDAFYDKKAGHDVRQALEEMLSNANHSVWDEEDLRNDLAYREKVTDGLVKKISIVTNLRKVENKLKDEAKKAKFPPHGEITAYRIRDYIKGVEERREKALVALPQFLSFEQSLPKEPLRFQYDSSYYKNHWLRVIALEEKAEKLLAQRRDKSKENNALESKLEKMQRDGPKLFGKQKWETEVSELKRKIAETKKEVDELEEKASKMRKDSYIRFPIIENNFYSHARGDILEDVMDGRKGMPEEVLEPVKTRLTEFAQAEIPQKIKELSQEYEKDREKINAHWND